MATNLRRNRVGMVCFCLDSLINSLHARRILKKRLSFVNLDRFLFFRTMAPVDGLL